MTISRFLQRITANGARNSEAQFTTSAFGLVQTQLKRNIFESGNTCKRDDYRRRLPPATTAAGIRLNQLCNKFLNTKRAMVDTQELSIRTFHDYHAGCVEILEHFGKERLVDDCRPEDFEAFRVKASTGRGLHAIGRMVTLTRMLFGFAFDNELIEKPIRFGQQFARPSKKSVRLHRARKQEKHGLRMFEAEEIRKLIDLASPAMKAMILLAINGGLGNSDLANLPKSAIQGDWLQFPRVKTGIDRRIPLCPETLKALTEAIERRPVAKDPSEAGLCFITKYGHRWVRQGPNGKSNVDKICDEFNKLLTDLNLKRDRLGFYALRHTFETIAGGCGDQVAVSSIIGHTDDSMTSLYREKIDDARLIIVPGECDQKPNGRWPGKEGATKTASRLADALNRTVCWSLPPDDAKDSGEDRSSNAWQKKCDLIIIAGTPRVPLPAIVDYLIQTGQLSAAGREPKWGVVRWNGLTESGEPVTVAGSGYLDATGQQAHRHLVRATIVQAIGRGRGILTNGCEVIVLSNEECGLRISDSETNPLNESELNILTVVHELTLGNPNAGFARTPEARGRGFAALRTRMSYA